MLALAGSAGFKFFAGEAAGPALYGLQPTWGGKHSILSSAAAAKASQANSAARCFRRNAPGHH